MSIRNAIQSSNRLDVRKIICLLFFSHFIHAEISWSPIEELAYPGVIYHDIAIDSKGNSHAVWVREDQNNFILEAAFKPFQGEWGSSTFISNLLKIGVSPPSIIIDSLDNLHLIWVEKNENNYFLKTAVKNFHEKWSSADTLASDQTEFSEICLAKNSFGSVFAAWNKKFSENLSIVQTSQREEGRHWSDPINLTSAGKYKYIDIGADDFTNVYVIWTSIESGSRYVQTSQRLSDNRWSNPSDFDRPGRLWGYYRKEGAETSIAVNSLGDAFGISKVAIDNMVYRVLCSYKNAESNWTESKPISEDGWWGGLILASDIAIDNLGNAFSVWYKYVPSFFSKGVHSIEVVNYSKMEGWSKPQSLIESTTFTGFPEIAINHLNNAIVVWDAETESDFIIQASFFSRDQGWSQPLNVSLNSPIFKARPKVTIDNMRRAHISWIEGPDNQGIIKIITAKFDM